MNRIVIVGSRGFLGRALVKEFSERRFPVVEIDRAPGKPDGNETYFQMDIRGFGAHSNPFLPGDVVVNSAGLAHQFNSSITPEDYWAVNAEGAEEVAKAAAQAGIRHFIQISTVAVYGDAATNKLVDETTPPAPADCYGASKFAGEQLIGRALGEYRIPLTILRLATLFGPEDPGNIRRLCETIVRGRFWGPGKGSNRKTLLHLEDACLAVFLVANEENPIPGVFNVGGYQKRMREVVHAIFQSLGKAPPRFLFPKFPALLLASLLAIFPHDRFRVIANTVKKWFREDCFSSGKFCKVYSFHPRVGFQAGIDGEVKWLQEELVKKLEYRHRFIFGGVSKENSGNFCL